MTSVSTEHTTDGAQIRTVHLQDEDVEFEVDENDVDVPHHTYLGDGQPPQEAVDVLEKWLKEYHDEAPPEALPDVDVQEATTDATKDDGASDDGQQEQAVDEDAPDSYQPN